MSHPDFDKFGTPVGRMREECIEVLLAIEKGERFGWLSANPLVPNSPTNFQQLASEMNDLIKRWDELRHHLLMQVRNGELSDG